MGQLPYFAISVLSFPSLSFSFISSKGQHRIWLKMGKAAAMLFIFMISAATTMPMLVLSCDSPPAATPPTVPGSGSSPPHGAVVKQPHAQGYGHGHAGQVTAAEAEKQQHTGLLGKLHRTNSSSSSSSSSSDEEGGKKKEGGRKKKGLKDKVKEKLPGGHQASS